MKRVLSRVQGASIPSECCCEQPLRRNCRMPMHARMHACLKYERCTNERVPSDWMLFAYGNLHACYIATCVCICTKSSKPQTLKTLRPKTPTPTKCKPEYRGAHPEAQSPQSPKPASPNTGRGYIIYIIYTSIMCCHTI